jgi:hypothetical protein
MSTDLPRVPPTSAAPARGACTVVDTHLEHNMTQAGRARGGGVVWEREVEVRV